MTRVVRHESDVDRWEMIRAAPDPRLQGHVISYCAYDERTSSFARRRELPTDRVVAIVNLGAPVRIWAPGRAPVEQSEGFLAGLDDTYGITETTGAQRGVQVDLTPAGAHGLLRLPMHELAREVVSLEALFGRAGRELREALGEAHDPFAILDAFFLERLDDALSPVPTVTRALARLKAAEGAVAIGALTEELGCSRRYLTAAFKEHVGLPPKVLARILRFNHAVQLMDSSLSWAEISSACGYYDQAHLVRDFQQFAGSPPSELARRQLPNGGGIRE